MIDAEALEKRSDKLEVELAATYNKKKTIFVNSLRRSARKKEEQRTSKKESDNRFRAQ